MRLTPQSRSLASVSSASSASVASVQSVSRASVSSLAAGFAAQISAAGSSCLGTLGGVQSSLGGFASLINSFLGGPTSASAASADIAAAQAFITSYMSAQMGQITDAAGCSSVISVMSATASRGCARGTSVRRRPRLPRLICAARCFGFVYQRRLRRVRGVCRASSSFRPSLTPAVLGHRRLRRADHRRRQHGPRLAQQRRVDPRRPALDHQRLPRRRLGLQPGPGRHRQRPGLHPVLRLGQRRPDQQRRRRLVRHLGHPGHRQPQLHARPVGASRRSRRAFADASTARRPSHACARVGRWPARRPVRRQRQPLRLIARSLTVLTNRFLSIRALQFGPAYFLRAWCESERHERGVLRREMMRGTRRTCEREGRHETGRTMWTARAARWAQSLFE